jgi:hypothetical protein
VTLLSEDVCWNSIELYGAESLGLERASSTVREGSDVCEFPREPMRETARELPRDRTCDGTKVVEYESGGASCESSLRACEPHLALMGICAAEVTSSSLAACSASSACFTSSLSCCSRSFCAFQA